jgi:hypothetical protein
VNIGAGIGMPQIPMSSLSWPNRIKAGLGRLPAGMFPVPQEVGAQMDPQTIKALRANALMQAGLGILAAQRQGAGLGAGMLAGLGQGQQVMSQGLGQAYAAQRGKREDDRLEMQDQRTKAMEERQARLDELAFKNQQGDDAFRASQAEYQREQDRIRLQERNQDQALDQKRFEATLGRQEAAEQRAREKEDLATRRYTSSVRKEFRLLPAVKNYETVLPIYESVKKAPTRGTAAWTGTTVSARSSTPTRWSARVNCSSRSRPAARCSACSARPASPWRRAGA